MLRRDVWMRLRASCRRVCRRGAVLAITSLSISTIEAGQDPATTSKQAPQNQQVGVRAEMRNVHFRFTDNVAVHINVLRGALVPVGDQEFPVLDDKNSFHIRIDSGEVALDPADLSNVFNSYVFARPHPPLTAVSISIVAGHLQMKGKLHDKGDIPFEAIGTLSPTADGKVRLHSEKVKALHVSVKGLMDTFGIEVSDLIRSGKVPGVTSENDDLIFDLAQIMPPPHLECKVTAIHLQGSRIVFAFGDSENHRGDKPLSSNYMSLQGNRLRFGKLTMHDTDIVLSGLEPNGPLDFYLDHYQEQLAAGYIKDRTNFQLRVFVQDYDKLNRGKTASKSPSN